MDSSPLGMLDAMRIGYAAYRFENYAEIQRFWLSKQSRDERFKEATSVRTGSNSSRLLRLPTEILEYILEYALMTPQNMEESYAENAAYRRPGYARPLQSHRHADILVLCYKIYALSLPLLMTARNATRWLGQGDRLPEEDWWGVPNHMVKRLMRFSGLLGTEAPRMRRVQIFAQMYRLEWKGMKEIVETRHFAVRILTLTIRHSDWNRWEEDKNLELKSGWVSQVRGKMPDCIQSLNIELETVKGREEEVYWIIRDLRKHWFFETKNGTRLLPELKRGGVWKRQWQGPNRLHKENMDRHATNGRVTYTILRQKFCPGHCPNTVEHDPKVSKGENADQPLDNHEFFKPEFPEEGISSDDRAQLWRDVEAWEVIDEGMETV